MGFCRAVCACPTAYERRRSRPAGPDRAPLLAVPVERDGDIPPDLVLPPNDRGLGVGARASDEAACAARWPGRARPARRVSGRDVADGDDPPPAPLPHGRVAQDAGCAIREATPNSRGSALRGHRRPPARAFTDEVIRRTATRAGSSALMSAGRAGSAVISPCRQPSTNACAIRSDCEPHRSSRGPARRSTRRDARIIVEGIGDAEVPARR
jgi:hypothetical protein